MEEILNTTWIMMWFSWACGAISAGLLVWKIMSEKYRDKNDPNQTTPKGDLR
jgi:hypothetical protein